MNLQELKQNQKASLDAAEALMKTAEAAGRGFTASENASYDAHMADFSSWGLQAKKIETKNTIRTLFNANGVPKWLHDEGAFTDARAGAMVPFPIQQAETHNPAYAASLHAFISTGGKSHGDELTAGADGNGGYYIPGSETYTQQRKPNGHFSRTGAQAAAYEGTDGGSGAAGGFAVNVQTEQLIAELALPDLGIFDASMVIPTSNSLKVPVQASFGTSAIKAESTGTIATFGGTDPTLGQVELEAYMVGALRMASWELLQDVQTFQAFIVNDLLKGQRILEGQMFATGNGTTQPQGVFGNTGTGTGSAYALTGTAATDSQTLLNALFDVTASLKGYYQANASWVMSRATGLAIRRAQMQSNLFVPIATTDADGTERILGRPVFYDVNAPALPTATTAGVLPILYGDFKAGNLIGVRGGAGINVKILDQPWAAQGQLGILAYRRVDSRVRLTEAIQQIKVSHS